MSKQDDLMYELLRAKGNKEKIFFGPTADERTTEIKDDHTWDLNNNMYLIRHRREYVVMVADKDKNNPTIERTDNNWTRSDFGRTGLGEYILMREVYPEEMK